MLDTINPSPTNNLIKTIKSNQQSNKLNSHICGYWTYGYYSVLLCFSLESKNNSNNSFVLPSFVLEPDFIVDIAVGNVHFFHDSF